jgi:predicted  nucleic acid-binding Zn-ribbon protein
MKIIGLKVDGVRKLTAVEMQFKNNGLVPIKGKNKNGKTSIIDSIELAIRGNKVANPKLIQNGKEKAEIELILSDYRIKRIIYNNGKTPKLEVKNVKTGILKTGEVQNFLNTLINEVTFNPFPFKSKTAVEKLNFFMGLCKEKLEAKSKELLGYGFAGIDEKLNSLEQDRLLTGREVKKFGDLDLNAPEKVESVDVQELLNKKKEIDDRDSLKRLEHENAKQKEIEEINAFNEIQRNKKTAIENASRSIKDFEEKISESQKRIDDLKKQLMDEETKWGGLNNSLNFAKINSATLPKPEPEKPLINSIPIPLYENDMNLEDQIQTALAKNQKAETYQNWLDKKKEKSEKENEYDAFTNDIKNLRNQKLEILRSIDTGVKGLEIREDGIYYNDVFSENWSDAESLRISAEVCIAQMPELRAVFLDRGESFDSDSLKELDKWATENDVLCITTIVDDIPEKLINGVFYIQEGHLIEATNE